MLVINAHIYLKAPDALIMVWKWSLEYTEPEHFRAETPEYTTLSKTRRKGFCLLLSFTEWKTQAQEMGEGAWQLSVFHYLHDFQLKFLILLKEILLL